MSDKTSSQETTDRTPPAPGAQGRADRFAELSALVDLAGKSGFSTFRYRSGDLSLELSVEADPAPAPAPAAPVVSPAAQAIPPASAPAPVPAAEPAGGHAVVSPITGTFYAAPGPGAPPYVNVGDAVAKGRTLCIVEAMKLMNEIKADRDGRIAKVVPKNEELVKQGQPLFLLEP